jgi:mannosyltransferase
MATAPARRRAFTNARLRRPGPAATTVLALTLLILASAFARTRELSAAYWIDEGLSWGISSHHFFSIPHVLRQDGSPPLYYLMLHVWMKLFGTSEEATHVLSLIPALATIPMGYWAGRSLFSQRAGWFAAGLFAFDTYLTTYAQETRMYSWMVLFSLIGTACFIHAFVFRRRRYLIGFALSIALMLYTHNWALFFAAACGVVWLFLLWRSSERRDLLVTGAVAFGGTVLLYLPWVPTTLYQAAHTGAPWSKAPSLAALASVPARVLGEVAEVAVFLAAGAGVLTLLRTRGALSRATASLLAIAVLTIVLAWLGSQVSPAWANRYLAAGVAPFLLLAAAGFAYAGRLGLVGLALVAVLWAIDGAPTEKSNVREVVESIAPSLRPGDLVVATQPEQVAVLHYYLPHGLRYATLTGAVRDPGVTDWRDGVERLEATSAPRDLRPLLDAMRPGQRLALVVPTIYAIGRWSAPWTRLVRLRSEEWLQYVSNDPRFGLTAIEPPSPFPASPNPVRARVYLKR